MATDDTPATPRSLAFENRAGGSADRAINNGHIIFPSQGARFEIVLTDTQQRHQVHLAYDDARDEYHGRCDCEGFIFHDGPCAHLWALFIAAGERTDANAPPDIPEVRELADGTSRCPVCGEPQPEPGVAPAPDP